MVRGIIVLNIWMHVVLIIMKLIFLGYIFPNMLLLNMSVIEFSSMVFSVMSMIHQYKAIVESFCLSPVIRFLKVITYDKKSNYILTIIFYSIYTIITIVLLFEPYTYHNTMCLIICYLLNIFWFEFFSVVYLYEKDDPIYTIAHLEYKVPDLEHGI